MRATVLPLLAAVLFTVGCSVDATKFTCSSSAECPTGYHCDLGTTGSAATFKCLNGAAPQKTLTADASKFLLVRAPSPDGTVRTTITAAAGAVTSTPDFIGVRLIASQGGADLADSQVASNGSVLAFQLPQATVQVSLRVQDDSGHSVPVTGYNQQVELGFEGKEVAGNANPSAAYDVSTTSDSLYPPASWISSGPGPDGGVAPEFAANDTLLSDGGVQSATSYASLAYLDFHQATSTSAPVPADSSSTSAGSSIGWLEFAPIPTNLNANATPPARVGGTLTSFGSPLGLVLYGGTTAAGGAVDTLGTFYTVDTLNGWTKVVPPAGVNAVPLGGAFAGVGLGSGGALSCTTPCTQFSLQFSMAGGFTNAAGAMTSKVVAYGTRTDSTVTPTLVTTGWFDAGNLPLANAAMASAPAIVPVSNNAASNTFDQYAGLLMVGGQAITAANNDTNGCLVYAGFASSPNTNAAKNTPFPCTGAGDPSGAFVTASGGIGFRTGVTLVPVDSTTFLLFGGSKSGGTSGNGPKNDLWQGKLACNSPGATTQCTTQVTWTQLPATGTPPTPRVNAGGAIWQTTITIISVFPIFQIQINRKLVIYGGTDASGALNDLWEYDLINNVWKQLRQDGGFAMAPATRTRPMMAGDGARSYVFGGLVAGAPTDQMWTTSRQGTARVLMKAPPGLPSIDTATGMKITVDGNGLTAPANTQAYLWDGSKWRFTGTGLSDAFGTRLVVSPTASGTAFVQPDGNLYLLLMQTQRSTVQFPGTTLGADRLKMTVDFK